MIKLCLLCNLKKHVFKIITSFKSLPLVLKTFNRTDILYGGLGSLYT